MTLPNDTPSDAGEAWDSPDVVAADGVGEESPGWGHTPRYEQRKMVAWFHPPQLIDTGMRAALASIFGTYADRRDLMATGKPPRIHDELASDREVWIDYIADVGDGWESTYTLAWLLGQKSLKVAGVGQELSRGQALILGGDQVYPTAKRDEYHHRFVGPYQASLPSFDESGAQRAPFMYAIPGNHDWYDGLTSFMRLFCQNRWIGGRRTQQSRSYFALKLPHNWWLWGIDTQLHADIDGPQLDYFRQVASGELLHGTKQSDFLRRQNIILCTAGPDWVFAAKGEPSAGRNLEYFEHRIIEPNGGRLRLTLTGDLHHYARYTGTRKATTPQGITQKYHKITAGGGGAYLYGTHELPTKIEWGRGAEHYTLECVYPTPKESRRMTRGALWAFLGLPHNYAFTLFLAAVYLLYAWLLQSTSKMLDAGPLGNQSFMEQVKDYSFTPAGAWEVLRTWIEVVAHGPPVMILTLVLLLGLAGFAGSKTKWSPLIGGLHGFVHILVAVFATWLFAYVNLVWWGMAVDGLPQIGLFVVEMMVVGGIMGGSLMGLYLFFANRLFGLHINEAFSCQAIADYKNFLRLHIDERGVLRVYPIKVPEVLRRQSWRDVRTESETSAASESAWYEPRAGVSVQHDLIEEPIEIIP